MNNHFALQMSNHCYFRRQISLASKHLKIVMSLLVFWVKIKCQSNCWEQCAIFCNTHTRFRNIVIILIFNCKYNVALVHQFAVVESMNVF